MNDWDNVTLAGNDNACVSASSGCAVPPPHGVAKVPLADGGAIVLRRHGNPGGPRLVLSHANGLAADAYYPFWSLLLAQFDVIVYDLRNHGHNPPTDLESHHVPMMVWDNIRVVRAIDRHFGAKPKVGIYHSISAAVALCQAVEERSFAALVLFDPPICPPGLPEARRARIAAMGALMAERARARKACFERWEDLAQSFRRARAFSRLVPGACEALARATLRPRADAQGFELCCPVDHEACVYEQFYKWALVADPGALDCPLKIIGADPLEPFSFLPAVDADMLVRVDYDFVPQSTHFLQLEAPQDCVALMLEFFERGGLA